MITFITNYFNVKVNIYKSKRQIYYRLFLLSYLFSPILDYTDPIVGLVNEN